MADWPKKPYKWIESDTLYISVPFTWNLPEVRAEILQGSFYWSRAVVGGPAVKLMPEYLADMAEIRNSYPGVLQKINSNATKSTEGCIRKCMFCAVPKIEGEFRELEEWPDRPVYIDNNILAASRAHFDKVIDRLKKHPYSDFNQGLDARLLTNYHAGRLAELRKPIIRLAWDTPGQEQAILAALGKLLGTGIPKSRIFCYVLLGYLDTPRESIYRLETLRNLGVKASPMWYHPIDCMDCRRPINESLGWNLELMRDFMKYWSNDRYFYKIPFDDFKRKQRGRKDTETLSLFKQVEK